MCKTLRILENICLYHGSETLRAAAVPQGGFTNPGVQAALGALALPRATKRPAVLLPGRDELGRLADFDPPAAAVFSPGVPAKDDGGPDLGVPLGDPPRLLLGDREPRRRGVGGYSSNFLSL